MTSSMMVHPDIRAALADLIDQTEHVVDRESGEIGTVHAFYEEPADSAGQRTDSYPMVVIYPNGGTQGDVDRVDRITLECYAVGAQAMTVLESVHASLLGWDIETDHGYLDQVASEQTPADIPYISETIRKSVCRLLVTTRPID